MTSLTTAQAAPAAAVQALPLAPRRSAGLDALRGYAILTMVLSGVVPEGILPSWMYHCQVPPPHHKFDPSVVGITWVDLVFPFFLFALGAAIPFALQRRMEKGMSQWQAVMMTIKRGALLAFFAIYQEHIVPYTIKSQPDGRAWLLGLLGFALLFPMLMRLPDRWPSKLTPVIRIVGWVGGFALLGMLGYPEVKEYLSTNPFTVRGVLHVYADKNNIILALLAAAAVFGTLAWIFTRGNLLLRLGLMGILMALLMTQYTPGWVQWASNLISIRNCFDLGFVYYLFIVIPGTIVGDMLLQWTRTPAEDKPAQGSWSARRFAAVCVLMVSFIVVNLVALKGRISPFVEVNLFGAHVKLIAATILLNAAMCIGGWQLVKKPTDSSEQLVSSLYKWGTYWLMLGLFFEPYQSGIKKDPVTMSYFFVTAGLAIFLLIAFTILIDIRHSKNKGLRLLIDNGQNPMIAYVGIANLITPVLALVGLGAIIDKYTLGSWLGRFEPWVGAGRGFMLTFILALVVSAFTRRKIFWRT